MAGYSAPLTLIDEMHPESIIDFRKYHLYLELQKERKKFLKSLREMSYYDWLIDKRLVEAGGIGKMVYILPARGGGSYMALKRMHELEGRDVEIVTLNKKSWPKLSSKDIETIRDSIQEFELYSKMVKPYRDPLYQELFKDFYPTEQYVVDPSWTVDPYGRYRIREVSLVYRGDMGELKG